MGLDYSFSNVELHMFYVFSVSGFEDGVMYKIGLVM